MLTRKEKYTLIFFVGMLLGGSDSESLLAFVLFHLGAILIMLYSMYKISLEVEKEGKK